MISEKWNDCPLCGTELELKMGYIQCPNMTKHDGFYKIHYWIACGESKMYHEALLIGKYRCYRSNSRCDINEIELNMDFPIYKLTEEKINKLINLL